MKINPLDRFLLAVMPRYACARLNARRAAELLESRAGYDAAGKGRRWFRGSSSSQNFETRKALVRVRDTARELERNNPYVTSAINVIVTNTVGAGIRPVAKHPTSKRKKALADDLMRDWASSTGCDYTDINNLYGMQSLAMRTQSLSGEALAIRRVTADRNLPVPLQIELLEGDYIDHNKDYYPASDIQLIQGIEVVRGKRTSYWLHDEHPGEPGAISRNSKQVNSQSIAHLYELLRPGQMRGLPRGYSAYTRLKKLDDFQDARVEQQIWAAALVGLIYSESGEGTGEGDVLPDKLEPGMFARLRGDERVTFNNPPSVGEHSSFVMPEQRIVASAYGITYEALTGDYSGVNFASGKMGRIQMFSNIHSWRHNMFIPLFCKRIERWFIDAALLRGYDISGVSYDWTPPKKEILDAKNELPAIVDEVRAGLNSWQNACRERGIDPVQLAKEIKEDIELFDSLEFILDIDPRRTTSSGQLQSINTATLPLTTKDDNEDVDDDQ